MKAIEALQSQGAWKAAISGAMPADLLSLSGAVTDIPAKLGASLGKLTDAVAVFESLKAGDANSIIGVVLAAIKAVVNSITKAAEKRERNYAEARLWYLSNVRGIRQANKLHNFWGDGDHGGDWRYPRASVAKDRAVPYWDPIGTRGNLPQWLVPYGWVEGGQWPGIGNWLPDDCTSWTAINLGAKCSGADNTILSDDGKSIKTIPVEHPTIVAWPWAYPLCSPARIAGLWAKASAGPETAVASLYMLPTPQHIATFADDVAESKRLLELAMSRWFPKAYLAGPGDWRNTGKSTPTGPWSRDIESGGAITGPDGSYTSAGVNFELLAAALARVHGFEVCRAAILEAPYLLPEDLRTLLAGNSDFSGMASKPLPGIQGDLLNGKASPSSGGGFIIVGGLIIGGAVLASFMWRNKRRK